MNIEIRPIAEDEFREWSSAEFLGFSGQATDEYVEIARSIAELDRTFGAFDGPDIVGTTTTRTTALTIPGGVSRLGFVDSVAVLPTHRRRGIMTEMLRVQLDQVHERGEPFAALEASESLIYERFGFGIASWMERWKIDRRHTAFKFPPQSGGSLRFIEPEAAHREWPKLHARLVADRVGMVHFNAAYWSASLRGFGESAHRMGECFHVAHVRKNRVSGLVSYRMHDRKVLVIFLLGEDSEVEAELWRYCFGIDLTTEIEGLAQSTDHHLPWRLQDSRRLERRAQDGMWLRLVDVRAALQRRTYDQDGSIVLRILDDFCPWNNGTYRLTSGPNGAECLLTDASPDIELGVAELSAMYLGGNSFSAVARAGRVTEATSGSLRVADRMFRTERPPWFLEL